MESFRAVLLWLILLTTLYSCGPKPSEQKDEQQARQIKKTRKVNEEGKPVKVVHLDKQTHEVVQVSTWAYDSQGRVLESVDNYRLRGERFRNEFSYGPQGIQSIKHYLNDKLIAEEYFDGSRQRPTKVLQYKKGRVVVREITRYRNSGKGPWVYQDKVNKIDNKRVTKKREGRRIYEKRWENGVLQEETIYNENNRAIEKRPLVKGYHTIIARHTYEKGNRNAIKETHVSWFVTPDKILDKVYPVKKEQFGLELVKELPQGKGIKVRYWKRSGKIKLKSETRTITSKGKPLW